MDAGTPYDWLNPTLPDKPQVDIEQAGVAIDAAISKDKRHRHRHQNTLMIGLEMIRREANITQMCNLLAVSEKTARKALQPFRDFGLVDVSIAENGSAYFKGNEHLPIALRRAMSLLRPTLRKRIPRIEPALITFEPFVGLWKEEPEDEPDIFRPATRIEAREFYQAYSDSAKAVYESIISWDRKGVPPIIAILYQLMFDGPLSTEVVADKVSGTAIEIKACLKLLRAHGIIKHGYNKRRKTLSGQWVVWRIVEEARMILPVIYKHMPSNKKKKCKPLKGLRRVLSVIE